MKVPRLLVCLSLAAASITACGSDSSAECQQMGDAVLAKFNTVQAITNDFARLAERERAQEITAEESSRAFSQLLELQNAENENLDRLISDLETQCGEDALQEILFGQ